MKTHFSQMFNISIKYKVIEMKKFSIHFTKSRRMKIDVWEEEIKLDLGKKSGRYKQN